MYKMCKTFMICKMYKTGLRWLTWLTWLTGLTGLTGLTRLTNIAPYYSILVDATGPEPIFKWTDGSPKILRTK